MADNINKIVCEMELDKYLYPTDIEGKLVWLIKEKDKDSYTPILFCPWCGRSLFNNENIRMHDIEDFQ